MNIKIIQISLIAAAAASLAGCSRRAEFEGSWTATSPTDISVLLPQAATASSLLTVTFIDDTNINGGSVVFSSLLNITQALEADTLAGFSEPYEVDIAGTATVGGTWMYKDDDRDELLLSIDVSSLAVNIDRNGVTFSHNLLTGAQQPRLDSLTDATAQAWKTDLTKALRSQFARYSVLDDVETHQKGSILSFEIQNPKEELHFKRTN